MEKTRMSVCIGHAGLAVHGGNKKCLNVKHFFIIGFLENLKLIAHIVCPIILGTRISFLRFAGKTIIRIRYVLSTYSRGSCRYRKGSLYLKCPPARWKVKTVFPC